MIKIAILTCFFAAVAAPAVALEDHQMGQRWRAKNLEFEYYYMLDRKSNDPAQDVSLGRIGEMHCGDKGVRFLLEADIAKLVSPVMNYVIGVMMKDGTVLAREEEPEYFDNHKTLPAHHFMAYYQDPRFPVKKTTIYDLTSAPQIEKQAYATAAAMCADLDVKKN